MELSAGQVQVFLGLQTVIVCESMQLVMRMVHRVAQTAAAVMITGETGTGKEHIARAIHHHSQRCARPFVDINCAALPEHLIESELFGYEKGAFSGADSPKPGLLELADRGTIFFDEIAELEPRMQVKLLRVLDGVSYYRLGGVKKVPVDVRVLAASNRNLEELVEAGRFRADLYHRLGQVNIRVPPLRERREDILPLAQFFLRQWSERACFSPEARQALVRWSWPGNVRELRNVVTKAAVMAESFEVGLSLLPAAMRQVPPPLEIVNGSYRLNHLERQAILEALLKVGGHQQKAADLLGISRRTLSRKLRSYRLEEVAQPSLV